MPLVVARSRKGMPAVREQGRYLEEDLTNAAAGQPQAGFRQCIFASIAPARAYDFANWAWHYTPLSRASLDTAASAFSFLHGRRHGHARCLEYMPCRAL